MRWRGLFLSRSKDVKKKKKKEVRMLRALRRNSRQRTPDQMPRKIEVSEARETQRPRKGC